ncbi:hypothetical protein XCR_1412 [Xanthomonas campestris pv. raphani 756C]|nr:hypothetical protein XCR_1412 [Xanthomonas campestris pv. raphani 756C]
MPPAVCACDIRHMRASGHEVDQRPANWQQWLIHAQVAR